MDCTDMWYVITDPLAKRFTKVESGVSCAADVPAFPCLRNGWTDQAEIWCVARGPLAMYSTQDGRCLH